MAVWSHCRARARVGMHAVSGPVLTQALPSASARTRSSAPALVRVLTLALGLALTLVLAPALAGCGFHAPTASGEGVVDPEAATSSPAATAGEATSMPTPTEPSAPKGSEPLVLIVVGFAGDGNGSGAVAYRDDVDWHELAFGSTDGVRAYYTGQSRGTFTWVPARERSAAGVDGNTCGADAENDGVVHVTLRRGHGHWFASRADSADGADGGADGAASGEGASAEDAGAADQTLDADFIECMRAAVRAAGPYVDFGSYDRDSDGVLERDELGVGIIVAGFERDGDWMDLLDDDAFPRIQAHANTLSKPASASASASADDPKAFPADTIIMGEMCTRVPASRVSDGAVDSDVMRVEPNSLATLSHELGHYLGLPDYYDTTYDDEAPWSGWTPSSLSVMDIGSVATVTFDDDTYERTATAFDPFSLVVLDWATPQEITESGTYEVRAEGAGGGRNVLRVESGVRGEYFLIENRQPVGRDLGLADAYADAADGGAGGVVVWHVDERAFVANVEKNEVNVPTHRPAITVQYLMGSSSADPSSTHTLSFDEGVAPDTDSAFWSASVARERYDELGVDAFELWTYGAGSQADDPRARAYCGIRLDFPDESADVMHVTIDLGR